MNSDEYLTSMDNRMKIKELLEESTSKTRGVVEKFIQSYLLIFLAVISIGGLGYMLFREIRYILASAPCPDALKSPIETLVEINAADYAADNVIDCSVVDIEIRNGGTLRILPNVVDNDSATDDFGIVLQANSFTIQQGGLLDLEGQGYEAGQQELHAGSGKSSVTVCGTCTDHPEMLNETDCENGGYVWLPAACGGSGGGHGGAGGRGDPDGSLVSGSVGQGYGEKEAPITLGSGGGESATSAAGGSGGGAIKLEVTGGFVNNGIINASGTSGQVVSNSGGGGGAGGSVWVEAGSFAGSGIIEADGGNGGEASRHGGGGGGGRVVMRCQNSNTFIDNGQVTVSEGVGGIQDGQVGTIIGPSCYPNQPENLIQYELTDDDPYTITEILDGKGTKKGTIVFKFDVSDIENESTLTPQIELREVGQEFTGVATNTGASIAYVGSPVEASVTVGGVTKTKEYKWRARVKDAFGVYSDWVEYETSPSEEIDFVVYGSPAYLMPVSGDNQAGTVGEILAVPFVVEIYDSAYHLLPDEVVTWQVKSGGGNVSDVTTYTNGSGQASTYLTLGTVSGDDNNNVDAIRSGALGSPMRFSATANPGPVDHYGVDSPRTAVDGEIFSPSVTIKSRDQYGNLVTNDDRELTISIVKAATPEENGNGTMDSPVPPQVTPTSGEATVSNLIYSLGGSDVSENVKVKVIDSQGAYGLSNSVLVTTSWGDCFGTPNVAGTLTLDNQTISFEADSTNGGVINCSEVDVEMINGTVVTLSSYDSGDGGWNDDLGVTLIAKSLAVDVTSQISTDGKGYSDSNRGPGGGDNCGGWCSGGGGGYGGYGGNSSCGGNIGGTPYAELFSSEQDGVGSIYKPTFLGSSGGSGGSYEGVGGAGGGAVFIDVTTSLTLNGIISSNGIAGGRSAGGGSGGSVLIDTQTFVGSGEVQANGGTVGECGGGCCGGGGGGGRVAIYYETDSSSILSTLGTGSPKVKAYGNGVSGYGGAGTIYVESKLKSATATFDKNLFVDNDNNDSLTAGLIEDPHEYAFDNITLTRYGHLDLMGQASVLNITDGSSLHGDSTISDLNIYGTFKYAGYGALYINELDVVIRGEILGVSNVVIGNLQEGNLTLYANTWAHSGEYGFNNITVGGNGNLDLMSYDSGDANWGNDYGVYLNVTNNLTVESGGFLSASELGYPGVRAASGRGEGAGSGCGDWCAGGGAGHGGYGALDGRNGSPNGEVYEPSNLGSSGGGSGNYNSKGGDGGGAMRVRVGGTLTINGAIESNGEDGEGAAGGGSGGSVWINANIITGGGTISADGGMGNNEAGVIGGGGSGGRISIYYDTDNSTILNTLGTDTPKVTAYGGAAQGYAGAGTIYIENVLAEEDPSYNGDLYVDNENNNTWPAGLIEGNYSFNTITLRRYGHLDVMGDGSHLTVIDGNGLIGDDTVPDLTVFGTIHGPENITIEKVDVGVRGAKDGFMNVVLANGGLTVYEHTWAHHVYEDFFVFGDIDVGALSTFTVDFGDVPGYYDEQSEKHAKVSIGNLIIRGTAQAFINTYDSGDTEWSDDYGAYLDISNDLTIESGGVLSGSELGYLGVRATSGRGEGAGVGCSGWCAGGGAGHGGYGALDGRNGSPNGGVYEPANIGSSGGGSSSYASKGGDGGGAMRVGVGGTLTINGAIESNGEDGEGAAGGGSGGSVWIETNKITGLGTISADGGIGKDTAGVLGGGASGGRIAIYYDTDTSSILNTLGTDGTKVTAYGGEAQGYAGAGTIYTEHTASQPSQGGNLYVDNENHDFKMAGLIPDNYQFSKITLRRYGHLEVQGEGTGCSNSSYINKTDCEANGFVWDGGSLLTVTSGSGLVGDSTIPDLTVYGTFNGPENITIEGLDVGIKGDKTGLNNVLLTNGGLTIYEHTWAHHDYENYFRFGDVEVSTASTFTVDFGDVPGDYGQSAKVEFSNLYVDDTGTVVIYGYDSGDTDWTNDYGVKFDITGDLTIQSGGGVDMTGNGYPGVYKGSGRGEGLGLGCGSYCAGGGGAYGGYGAHTRGGDPNGDVYEPTSLGSSGGGSGGYKGTGGNGGGAIELTVGGIVALDGYIYADGAIAGTSSGGGSGGGILINTQEFRGSGTISANGGDINACGGGVCGGGGSGGRIAIYYDVDNSSILETLGTDDSKITAFGGYGTGYAGAGTIYVEDKTSQSPQAGNLYVDNNSRDYESAGIIPGDYVFDNVNLINSGNLEVMGEGTGCNNTEYTNKSDCESNGGTWDGGSTLTLASGTALSGDETIPELRVPGTIVAPANFEINGVNLVVSGDILLGVSNNQSNIIIGGLPGGGLTLYAHTFARSGDYAFNDISVGEGGQINMVGYDDGDDDWTDDYGVELNINNLTVAAQGLISSEGLGYGADRGPGYSGNNRGGSYGGYGQNETNGSYGDLYEPLDLGSGGGAGAGGGAVKINVANNLLLNGEVNSNGQDGSGGSGSGGSVLVNTKIIGGSGSIISNGSDYSYDSAGGRVALYYEENSTESPFNLDINHLQARGFAASGPGTIYIEQVGVQEYHRGDLYVDNGGITGTKGPDFSPQDWTFDNVYIGNNVKVGIKGDRDVLPDGVNYPEVPVSSQLGLEGSTISLWNLNEENNGTCSDGRDVCDSGANGNNGTVTGTTVVDGRYGKARQFNGSSDAITFINPDSLIPNLSRTYVVWFYPTKTSESVIIGGDSGTYGNIIRVSNNGINVYNAGTWTMYINGVKYTGVTGDVPSSVNLNSWNLLVAYQTSTVTWTNFYVGKAKNNRYYGGSIDDVAVFNKILTDNEAAAIYAGTSFSEYQSYFEAYQGIFNQRIGRGVVFDLTGDFTLGDGAVLDGTLEGFETDKGPEPGGIGAGSSAGGGGGHGGAGGLGQNDTAHEDTLGGEGNNYDSPVLPVNLGSGGGSGGTGAVGGVGGGAVFIETEDGTVTINGEIDVSGGNGTVTGDAGGGGGAGGSIYLKACDIVLGATGVLDASGGNAGVSTYVGGGGGGGIIVLAHTCLSTVTIDPAAVIDKDEGTGYQAGGEGVYGLYGMPNIYSEDQYSKNDEQLSVGAEVSERAVKFKFDVVDPDTTDTLTPQVEVLEAGDGASFNSTNILVGNAVAWSGGTDPIELEVLAERANGQGSINNVLGITSDELTWGEDYKWRGRVVDDNGVASDWVEFGDNDDGTDFQIASAPTCGNGVVEYGEECDGSDLDGETCESQGYPGGTLSCTGSCTFDIGECWECGNGVIEPGNGEQCDDGELGSLTCTDFDEFIGGILGCDASCQYETGTCTPGYCGDGIEQSWEECDDGNTDNGDGCSAICEEEDLRYCGDGTIDEDLGEECDDGNSENGDGCSNVCEIEDITGYCGDGVRDEDEECDDGNQLNGDGCSNVCVVEQENEEGEIEYCGDGTRNEGEECDDGNQTSGDGCSNTCSVEVEGAGYCGDGTLGAGEGCDDGNQTSGDGCSNVCNIETLTIHYCGDGTQDSEEECDDGNQKNGDGCSNQCVVEPNEETAVCGNGIIEPGEHCDGDEFGDLKCESFFGFIGGSRKLECTSDCRIDVTSCIKRGEGIEIFGLPLTGELQMVVLVSANILSLILAIIAVILGFPSLLFRRERKPWGVVYDKAKEKPVAFATVRIFEQDKLIEQKVTDLEGRYGFTVKSGDYDLEVTHGNYEKFREKITVGGKEEGSINRDVALTSKSGEKVGLKERVKSLLAKARETFPRVSRYTFVLGLVFSVIATIISPVVYNFVVIGFYVLVAIMYWLFGVRKGDGKVYDARSGNGIKGAFVRVFSAKDNKLIDNQMTYEDGSYMFILEPGTYYLLASKKGYKFPSKKEEKRVKKAFYGSLVEVELKKGKTLSENLGMDERDSEQQAVQKEEKFGSPFGS